jgi:hypothetical protein
MILAEKKALKEKRNYLNMVIQQKKNKSSISSYYFIPRYSRLRRKYFYRRRRYFYRKRLKLSIYEKKRLIFRLKNIYFVKKYSFFFSRNRVDSVRLKKYLFKFKRRFKRKL